MKVASHLSQLLLVAATAAALVVISLMVSLGRPGLPAEITDAALASPEARAEIASTITSDLTRAAPTLAGIPGIEALVQEAVESPALETPIQGWVEHGVRARLGEDVGPLVLHPNQILQSNNPLVATAIGALPPVELQPAPAVNRSLLQTFTLALVLSLVIVAGSHIAVRRTTGRARAALLVGLGGLLAAFGLLALPASAPILGALPAVAATTTVVPTSIVVIAGASGLIILRAIFAQTGLLPYRTPNGIASTEHGSLGLDFVVLD